MPLCHVGALERGEADVGVDHLRTTPRLPDRFGEAGREVQRTTGRLDAAIAAACQHLGHQLPRRSSRQRHVEHGQRLSECRSVGRDVDRRPLHRRDAEASQVYDVAIGQRHGVDLPLGSTTTAALGITCHVNTRRIGLQERDAVHGGSGLVAEHDGVAAAFRGHGSQSPQAKQLITPRGRREPLKRPGVHARCQMDQFAAADRRDEPGVRPPRLEHRGPSDQAQLVHRQIID